MYKITPCTIAPTINAATINLKNNPHTSTFLYMYPSGDVLFWAKACPIKLTYRIVKSGKKANNIQYLDCNLINSFCVGT